VSIWAKHFQLLRAAESETSRYGIITFLCVYCCRLVYHVLFRKSVILRRRISHMWHRLRSSSMRILRSVRSEVTVNQWHAVCAGPLVYLCYPHSQISSEQWLCQGFGQLFLIVVCAVQGIVSEFVVKHNAAIVNAFWHKRVFLPLSSFWGFIKTEISFYSLNWLTMLNYIGPHMLVVFKEKKYSLWKKQLNIVVLWGWCFSCWEISNGSILLPSKHLHATSCR